MKRSTDRILTTHVGSLVRPPGLVDLMRAKEHGQDYDRQDLATRVQLSVREVVHKQVETGVDILSDGEYGEYGKPSFSGYVNERLSGFSQGAFTPRVHASIMWAKLQALTEGAELATRQLWPRSSG